MKNKIKMEIFKDESSPMRKMLIRPLPELIQSYNTQILYKSSPQKEYAMIYLIPRFRSLYQPISFDALFLTGEYSGLHLSNIKPYSFDILTSNSGDYPADIIPERLKDPSELNNQYYQFKIGDYQSNYSSCNKIIDMFNEIRQWDTVSIETIKHTIDKLNYLANFNFEPK